MSNEMLIHTYILWTGSARIGVIGMKIKKGTFSKMTSKTCGSCSYSCNQKILMFPLHFITFINLIIKFILMFYLKREGFFIQWLLSLNFISIISFVKLVHVMIMEVWYKLQRHDSLKSSRSFWVLQIKIKLFFGNEETCRWPTPQYTTTLVIT